MLEVGRPRRPAADRQPSTTALAFYLNAGWGARRPDRRIRVHLPTARGRAPARGAALRPLLLRAGPPRLPPPLARPRAGGLARAARAARGASDPRQDFRGSVEPIEAGASGIATKWDAWAEAPRTTLVPIAWPDKGKPDGQGPITQLELLYRSDVGGPPAGGARRRADPDPRTGTVLKGALRTMSDTDLQTAANARRDREDHRRGARPQDRRPLGPRGGARPLLRGRRGGLDPDPAASSGSIPRPSRSRPTTDPRAAPARRSCSTAPTSSPACAARRATSRSSPAASYKGPLIAAEGDSWFQYPFCLKDVIDWVFETFAVYCRSEAGDTLENMVRRAEYLDALERTGGRVLLLSGGGNDLVAGGNLAAAPAPLRPAPARRRSTCCPPSAASSTAPSPTSRRSCAPSAAPSRPAAVICHGYDYTDPERRQLARQADGRRAASPTTVLQKAIAHEMVDRLNTRLINLANQTPRIAFVDVPRHRRRRPLARRAAPDRRGLRPT